MSAVTLRVTSILNNVQYRTLSKALDASRKVQKQKIDDVHTMIVILREP